MVRKWNCEHLLQTIFFVISKSLPSIAVTTWLETEFIQTTSSCRHYWLAGLFSPTNNITVISCFLLFDLKELVQAAVYMKVVSKYFYPGQLYTVCMR